MCAMDSDGVSAQYATGPAFCFLMANDTVVEQPLRIENFTSTISQHAVAFIERQTPAQPFFFLMAYFHVHTPLFTNRTNRGRSRGGTFGDNIEEMDDSVGELMAAVERARLRDNTLVFLTSDNGPYQEEGWENSGALVRAPVAVYTMKQPALTWLLLWQDGSMYTMHQATVSAG
jgi:arylsulfatase A-like enzyme